MNGQLPLSLVPKESVPVLPELTKKGRIVTDVLLMGLAVRGASMDLVADQLHEGMTPSHRLAEKRVGEEVTVAGLVAVRPSPETAKGFVFHTLEDYHGLMNIITAPASSRSIGGSSRASPL